MIGVSSDPGAVAAVEMAMAGGLVAGYGTFFAYAGRYLYPARPTRKAWLFVTPLDDLAVGDAMTYTSPGGEKIVITRNTAGRTGEDCRALSSTCPHLGCQVKWEPHNDRFFCPCHNGVFTPEGVGSEGPPVGMELVRYPLKVDDNGLLFIEVPVESVDPAGTRKRLPGEEA